MCERRWSASVVLLPGSIFSDLTSFAVFVPTPLGFERVLGAMLTSVPDVRSSALPLLEGSRETTLLLARLSAMYGESTCLFVVALSFAQAPKR